MDLRWGLVCSRVPGEGAAQAGTEDLLTVPLAKLWKATLSPQLPQQPGDHPGLEPSMTTIASQPSSSGQVSSQTSKVELVLEEPQGPARHRRAR